MFNIRNIIYIIIVISVLKIIISKLYYFIIIIAAGSIWPAAILTPNGSGSMEGFPL